MATINRALADKLVKGKGKSKEGSAGYVLVRYQNRTKYDIPGADMYDPDAEVNVFDYAVFNTKRAYEHFMESDMVGGVDILWASEKFKKDEVKRQEKELSAELMEGAADMLYGLEKYTDIKPGRRER